MLLFPTVSFIAYLLFSSLLLLQKGGSTLSQNRKAWQAGIAVDWSKETAGDPIAAVTRRLFDYANHVTGYNMKVEGQEDLMSIQYFGNGTDDPTPDRYTPHCDGECDGLPHKKGARVATMVMYCDVPELGGGTNFQNANVFAKPQQGAAAFFSYMDPKTGDHETGFTSHSGCPVLLGTKRIAVQWMRVGVDTENPWDSFDVSYFAAQLGRVSDISLTLVTLPIMFSMVVSLYIVQFIYEDKHNFEKTKRRFDVDQKGHKKAPW